MLNTTTKLFLAGLGLGLVALLIGPARAPAPAAGQEPTSPAEAARHDLAKLATEREAAGDLEGATALWKQASEADPKAFSHRLKVAELIVTTGKLQAARKLLLELAKEEAQPPATRCRLHSLMVQAFSPELSKINKAALRDATDHILLAQEQRRSADEREIRPWMRPHDQSYAKAKELLDKVVAECPDHMSAQLSLGVVNENRTYYHTAAEAYRAFLRLAEANGFPDSPERSEIARRLYQCEARYQEEARLKVLVVGKWKSFSALPGAAYPPAGSDIELLPDNKVNGQAEAGWSIYDNLLIIYGARGTPQEWCNAGRLSPNARSFEGLTLGQHLTKYEKQP